MILGLTAPSEGAILFEGRDLDAAADASVRSRAVQMVFQNPGSSLNPRRSIGQSIAVPLEARRIATRGNRSPRRAPARHGAIARRLRDPLSA